MCDVEKKSWPHLIPLPPPRRPTLHFKQPHGDLITGNSPSTHIISTKPCNNAKFEVKKLHCSKDYNKTQIAFSFKSDLNILNWYTANSRKSRF